MKHFHDDGDAMSLSIDVQHYTAIEETTLDACSIDSLSLFVIQFEYRISTAAENRSAVIDALVCVAWRN